MNSQENNQEKLPELESNIASSNSSEFIDVKSSNPISSAKWLDNYGNEVEQVFGFNANAELKTVSELLII